MHTKVLRSVSQGGFISFHHLNSIMLLVITRSSDFLLLLDSHSSLLYTIATCVSQNHCKFNMCNLEAHILFFKTVFALPAIFPFSADGTQTTNLLRPEISNSFLVFYFPLSPSFSSPVRLQSWVKWFTLQLALHAPFAPLVTLLVWIHHALGHTRLNWGHICNAPGPYASGCFPSMGSLVKS